MPSIATSPEARLIAPPTSGIEDVASAEEARPVRSSLVEVGVALVVIGCPIAFLPASADPFVDIKLFLLLVGCAAIWLGGPVVDRSAAALAGVWVVAMVLASWFGVDRWVSVAGPDNLGNGLILFVPCAFLFVIGTSITDDVAARIPRWIFRVALAVGMIGLVWRFVPSVVSTVVSNVAFDGATLGHPVLLAGITAVGIVAAVGTDLGRRRAWSLTGVAVLTTALSVSTKRAGLVAVAVGLVIAWMSMSAQRRRLVQVAAVCLVATLAWVVVSPFVASTQPLSPVPRFEELGSDSARARILFTGALLRASAARPALGWGLGNTGTAYLLNASERDVVLGERGVTDAHNIVLASLVTSGALGLAAFLALVVLVGRRARRARPERRWAVALASALFAFHLLQPASVSLTPMLFLVAGIAAGRREPAPAPVSATGVRASRAAIGVVLAAGMVLSALILASSVFEQWGRTYGSAPELRAAATATPWRLSPVRALALVRAVDATAGSATARAEARELASDLIARHPWSPNVRLIAADVAFVLDDEERARGFLREQLALFPADRGWLPPAAVAFAEGGPRPPPVTLVQSPGSDAEAG